MSFVGIVSPGQFLDKFGKESKRDERQPELVTRSDKLLISGLVSKN